jgi:hypothetical protein
MKLNLTTQFKFANASVEFTSCNLINAYIRSLGNNSAQYK